MNDRLTEYPLLINTLKRFNLYPEVVLASWYRVYSTTMEFFSIPTKKTRNPSRNSMVALGVSTVMFMLPWQFAQFVLLTQLINKATPDRVLGRVPAQRTSPCSGTCSSTKNLTVSWDVFQHREPHRAQGRVPAQRTSPCLVLGRVPVQRNLTVSWDVFQYREPHRVWEVPAQRTSPCSGTCSSTENLTVLRDVFQHSF
ncbi:putative C-mannosyltransferase DPY19L1 [Bagarius yarrelli]|uniref:Putative C-mannosyltransferase DPY19L1 n=1 Tax=Bagarius yarrelli TaxID=175774 RepID=A0A556VUN4_BAGYA|nr:putative C-mannosyltransferase DPY19L1 [Bagarius yarrelli]